MNVKILYPPIESIHTSENTTVDAQSKAVSRLLFIDNLRVFLTILVILHHLINIYAASGSWIYQEGRQDMLAALLGKWFTVVNQSYFMGLFMLISAYFVPGSYDRKGAWHFVKDRLVRLGIPLALYSWIIRPLLIYAGLSSGGELNQPFFGWYPWQYFHDYSFLGGGPLWFISALLIFSIAYALVRRLMPAHPPKLLVDEGVPGNGAVALLAGGVALASFIVRLWYPSDKVFGPLGFQFADFPQYIALFIVGLVAYRRNWLVRMPENVGRTWLKIAPILILLWPPMVILLGAFENLDLFLGGWHWQSLLAATWQSFLGISMCVCAVYLFKKHMDKQCALSRFLSRNAYTAYLSHEAVITFAAVLVAGVVIYPLLKFGIMALVTVPLIFVLSSLVRKLPFTENIL